MKVYRMLNMIPDKYYLLPADEIYKCIKTFATRINTYQFLNLNFEIEKEINTFYITDYHKVDITKIANSDLTCCRCNFIDISFFRKEVNTTLYFLLYPIQIKINNQDAYAVFSFHDVVTNYWAVYDLVTVSNNIISFLSVHNVDKILRALNTDSCYDTVVNAFTQLNTYINAQKALAKIK